MFQFSRKTSSKMFLPSSLAIALTCGGISGGIIGFDAGSMCGAIYFEDKLFFGFFGSGFGVIFATAADAIIDDVNKKNKKVN